MVMAAHRSGPPEDFLLDGFLALETPAGFRAELIDGEIVVAPPPDGNHEDVISQIIKQVVRLSAVEMDLSPTKGLKVPSRGVAEEGRAIPDCTFAPASLRLFRDAPPWMSPQGVALVAEVTSTRAEVDRDDKRRAYAGAQIPLYLLVDRQRDKVTLFSAPSGDDYVHAQTVPFGSGVELPEPFAFTLDTSGFGG
jgi:Uma2 family endonuclease